MARITDLNHYEDWEKPYVEIKKVSRWKFYSLGIVPLDVLIKNQPRKHRRIKSKGVCEICKSDFEIMWNKFCRRKNSETNQRGACRSFHEGLEPCHRTGTDYRSQLG